MYNMPARLVFTPMTKSGREKSSGKAENAFLESNKTKTPAEAEADIALVNPGNTAKPKPEEGFDIARKNLQEAIVWSEILGKPVCKRRKRKYYGN